mmetsp:Transcript_55762/g.83043  ORF Transcript_55762/g.83043 Transcript_55762/m.83043 type:complete len:139 (-) Transcript_55762:1799-2215(-)
MSTVPTTEERKKKQEKAKTEFDGILGEAKAPKGIGEGLSNGAGNIVGGMLGGVGVVVLAPTLGAAAGSKNGGIVGGFVGGAAGGLVGLIAAPVVMVAGECFSPLSLSLSRVVRNALHCSLRCLISFFYTESSYKYRSE